MLMSDTSDNSGMYRIWKIEKEVWLTGQAAMKKYVKPDAIIIPPAPLTPMRFEQLLDAAKRAEPFLEVELQEQKFLKLDHTIVISYLASAKHKRYRARYYARCSTTYVKENGVFIIAAHTHNRLPKTLLS